ncbi:MAG: ATP-dependent Clp protease ATP-binding subunit, partial [Opitutales bacterium]|nr:ATP-dependent Clp protease ATP-binding subunit [Opitutales bacterium]
IMTSNVGANLIQKQTSLGFGAPTTGIDDFEKIKEKISEETKRVFKPEFINRISEMVVFRSLEKEDLFKIVDLEIGEVSKRLKDREIFLSFEKAAKELLIEKGFDQKYGARPLRRAVERHLEDPLAEAILRGDVKTGEPIVVDREGDHLTFEQKSPTEEVSS